MLSSCTSFRPDPRVLVNLTALSVMSYRMADEYPTCFEQCILQCIARGGKGQIYCMGPPTLELFNFVVIRHHWIVLFLIG